MNAPNKRGALSVLSVLSALCGGLAIAVLPAAAAELDLLVGDITDSRWEYTSFKDIKETAYTVVDDARLTTPVLLADSEQGASGWTLKQNIDLRRAPWLHVLWKAEEIGANTAERTRAGDDFLWRVYFITKSFIRYRTLGFVYSQTMPVGEVWRNPYAGTLNDAYNRALARHDAEAVGKWAISSVNVAAAWRDAFQELDDIQGVGIMTDGDSSGVSMRAVYGGIVLSDSPTPPAWMTDSIVAD